MKIQYSIFPLKKAFEEHDGDLVCVLDVDEFIISQDGTNPREILEKLDTSFYYLIKWITYVPTENDIYNDFVPKRIKYIRDPSLEEFYKVIVPKNIFNNFKIELTMGNHDLAFNDNENIPSISKKDLNLRIAHFPIRSKEQCMSKVLVGWPNIISINTENRSWGWHWQNIFDKIKSNNDITDKDVETFAKNYALKNQTDINIEYKPINLDFCKNIDIKYYFEYNYLNNILNNSVELANEIKNLKNNLKN